MYRITSDSVHYYRENELGDQLSRASISIWDKANGISILSRVLSDAISNSSTGKDGGMAMTIGDISSAIDAIANFSHIVSMDIANLHEVISSNDAMKKLNELDADNHVFRTEYNYRHNSLDEDKAENDKLYKRTA
ncbi:MAG: hypothetical protein Q8J85_04755 [Sulfuricurvum sp.]|nr:hypothetical protein [Sulfuricurvum sp.]MDP3022715.1 hypothetical protein [Sulfuricurvum sp.]